MAGMNLNELSGHAILLFGKSRALEATEFLIQLKARDISLAEHFDASVVKIVEGRMINPVAQMEFDRLYEEDAAPIIMIDELERVLCEQIDGGKLLMSLKLSGDQERLLGFLQNPYIDNALFLRLLKLYNWQKEGFFENDENRDVTAALIERFYENIERNHNVQYANMGIMHLLTQSDNEELIETISSLAPIQTALREGCDRSTYKILREIAIHKQTPARVQKQFVKYGDDELQAIIALRQDTTAALQEQLLKLNDETITLTLASNVKLNDVIAEKLYENEEYRSYLAANKQMDDRWFELFLLTLPEALAANATLTLSMQQQLLKKGSETLWSVLASNPSLLVADELFTKESEAVNKALALNEVTPSQMLEMLFKTGNTNVELAANTKTPIAILMQLGSSQDIAVLSALAQNSATPVELLYQFQLDQRLERYVMSNPGFGEHIQTENIGWL